MHSDERPTVSLAAQRAALLQRFVADLQRGRTISAHPGTIEDPTIRADLVQLLDAAHRDAGIAVAPEVAVPGHTILGEIGRGGMSTVYLARNDRLGRAVALKVLPAWLTGDEHARARFLREARALAMLAHENVVAVHEVIEQGDLLAIAMEWVDGLSLRDLLRRLPALPGPEDMEVLAAALGTPREALSAHREFAPFVTGRLVLIARAVQVAHAAGLLHRDIKPSNILVRRDGVPKLADFGTVRARELDHSQTHSFAGTPAYAAPEQLLADERQIGPATDVYGLGLTLYEALARRLPFPDDNLPAMLQQIQAGAIPRLTALVDVPRDLETIVQRAIDPEPKRRYATAGALADDLQAFLDYRPVTARPLSRPLRLLRWTRREPWQALLAAVLLVAVPTTLLLGGKLLLEMPRIEAQRQREARALAMRELQAGFQEFFAFADAGAAAAGHFAAALQLVPDMPDTLACLGTTWGHADPAAAVRVLQEHAEALARHRGLRLLLEMARERRVELRADEADELAAGSDPVDLLVATLHGLFVAADEDTPSFYQRLLPLLVGINLQAKEASPLYQGLLAYCAGQAGDAALLARTVRSMQDQWPDDEDTWIWTALIYNATDPERAIAACRRALALGATSRKHELLLIGLMTQSGKAREAEDYVRRLADESPQEAYYLPSLGEILRTQGRFAEFQRDVEPKLHLDSPEARLLLGRAYRTARPQTRERLAAAERHLRAGLELTAPLQRPDLLFELALVLLAQPAGSKEGLELLREAVRLRPHKSLFRWQLALALTEAGESGQARQYLDTLRDHAPSNPALLWDLVRCYLRLSDYAAMVPLCERWRQIPGQEGRALYHLGLAQSRLGQCGPALQSLLAHQKVRPYHQSFTELAWLRLDPRTPAGLRDPQQALRDARQALRGYQDRKLEPGPWLLRVLAEAQFATGDRAGAARTARQAIAALGRREIEAPPTLEQDLQAALARYAQ